MKTSKYVDASAVAQIIGTLYNNPKLLEKTDKYHFIEQDFPNKFLKIAFLCINDIYQLGASQITIPAIEDYLAQRPKYAAEYKVNKGSEFILACAENANENTFDYYYNRLKKMTLFRGYAKLGLDLSWLYDPDNIFDSKKKQEQEDFIDNTSLADIASLIDAKIEEIKELYVDDVQDDGCHMGDGVDEFLEELEREPALGYPLYGKYMNTVTRGARLGKFFLDSAATGVGKTRNMVAQCCFIGCSQMYDVTANKWVPIGAAQDTLFIATEQDLRECQSLCLAFLSGVDEEHILTCEYFSGERERIDKAKQILKQSKIHFECMPEFDLKTIKTAIKKHIREDHVQYVFFDYIHSSASILMEIGAKAGIKSLREDNVLFLLSSALKEIAVKEDIFVFSGTQLNGDYKESDTPDQNLLRGSKAIADRIDIGMIMLEVTKEDREKLAAFCQKNNFPMPNVKLSIYKNRQGRHKNMYLWLNADRGNCRFDPIFATDWNYHPIEMDNLKIAVEEESIEF